MTKNVSLRYFLAINLLKGNKLLTAQSFKGFGKKANKYEHNEVILLNHKKKYNKN
jgi:hypothetical protein